MITDNEKVSEWWATDRSKGMHSWLQHPFSRSTINTRISGDPDLSTVLWFKNRFLPQPAELCLALGCGHGVFDRQAIECGLARHVHAIDISQGAIDSARKAARDAGLAAQIDYEVADINKISLPASQYDLVVAMSSVHHVAELENLFAQCARTLKPGGLLFMDEYTGPSRFQTPPELRGLIDGILKMLPPRYRRNLFTNDGATKDDYVVPTVEQMIAGDPSEAVRSAEIMTVLPQHFEVVEYRPYGGGIQHQLFSGIMGNFDPESASDLKVLKAISDLELSLEGLGAVPTEFAVVVARPLR